MIPNSYHYKNLNSCLGKFLYNLLDNHHNILLDMWYHIHIDTLHYMWYDMFFYNHLHTNAYNFLYKKECSR
ncbi:MAG: hypothetical protein IJ148_03780 [Bacteroidaceae bacterium]|nr:hypothetical protein [Bacteroidaceae bacterium]